jgi:hypothetical protein
LRTWKWNAGYATLKNKKIVFQAHHEFSTLAINFPLEKVCSFSLWWMIYITLPSGNAIFHTHVSYGTWKVFMVIYILLLFVNIDYVDIPIEKLSLI